MVLIRLLLSSLSVRVFQWGGSWSEDAPWVTILSHAFSGALEGQIMPSSLAFELAGVPLLSACGRGDEPGPAGLGCLPLSCSAHPLPPSHSLLAGRKSSLGGPSGTHRIVLRGRCSRARLDWLYWLLISSCFLSCLWLTPFWLMGCPMSEGQPSLLRMSWKGCLLVRQSPRGPQRELNQGFGNPRGLSHDPSLPLKPSCAF